MRRWFCLAVPLLAACTSTRLPSSNEPAPGVAFHHSIAEGSGDAVDPDGPPRPRPARSASEPGPPVVSRHAPPDPEALRVAEQWEYELEWNRGALSVLAVTRRTFPQPVVTARRMGRFAIELWIGQELVERVRFDFPALAVDDAKSGELVPGGAPVLGKGAHVKTRVLVPSASRARRAVLVDRATGGQTPLAWPPEPVAAAPAASVGAPPAP